MNHVTKRQYITIQDFKREAAPRAQGGEAKLKLVLMLALTTASILVATIAFAGDQETRYCNPKVSKPCGASCILLAKACHIPWTTSKVGERKKVAKAQFDAPKYLEKKPE